MCFKNDQSGGILALGCAQVEGLTFTNVLPGGFYTVAVTSVVMGGSDLDLGTSTKVVIYGRGCLVGW